MQRYGIINEKNPREIVLLRGSGCVYKECSFCDYHLDKCSDEAENFALNSSVLSKVTGQYGDLEVINSGSVFELDEKTLALISETCHQRISTLFILKRTTFSEKGFPRSANVSATSC